MSKNLKSLCHVIVFATIAIIADTFCFAQSERPAPLVRADVVSTANNSVTRHYTGQLTSPSHVAIVARVSGEIMKIGFKDGDLVKKGQLLYQLDDIRYSAAVQSAQANIERCEASLQYSTSNLARVESLFKKNVMTRDAFEAAAMTANTDKANLHLAKASLITAEDDLNKTKIIAPIDGKMSITNFTVGNYVTLSSGPLATLVQLDPLRVGFSIASRDYMTLFKDEQDVEDNAQIHIRLANGMLYEHEGKFEFINNEANKSTDTVQVYVSIANPELILVPGSTVTIVLTRKSKDMRAAIPPTAIMSDRNTTYVYVLDAGNVATRRDVKLGAVVGKLQIVESGLKGGERIVTDGIHKVIPGKKVQVAQKQAK